MPLNKLLDCKDTAAQYDYRPVFYACFGPKRLPGAFSAKLGPVTSTGPVDCATLGWPTTQIDITLARQGPCEYVWAWSNGSVGVLLSTGLVAPLMCQTANMPDISAQTSNGTYWYLLNATNVTGSCSWNPSTNETTFSMSATIVEEPGCSIPIIITYQGV